MIKTVPNMIKITKKGIFIAIINCNNLKIILKHRKVRLSTVTKKMTLNH